MALATARPVLPDLIARCAQAEAEACLALVGGQPTGLTSAEARARLARFGPNEVATGVRSPLTILGELVRNGLVLLLAGAGLLTLALHDFLDGLIILGLLALNTGLMFLQEYRAERALESLRRLLPVQAQVCRDGRWQTLPAALLVPGDLVRLSAGRLVPADIRLLRAVGLQVSEAPLTGESLWQEKTADPLPVPPRTLRDLRNIVLAGSLVLAGEGEGVVVATGTATLFGQTATLLADIRRPGQFHRQLDHFAAFLLRLALVLLGVVLVANIALGRPPVQSLALALAVALGTAPEALPAVTATALALGAAHLARQRVLTRRLAAIEELSGIDVLCTDKTGTITQNRTVVEEVWSPLGPETLLALAVLCSSFPEEGRDPVDDALISAARAHRLDLARLAARPRRVILPFTAERKRMCVRLEDPPEIVCKGAARIILERCHQLLTPEGPRPLAAGAGEVQARVEAWQAEGRRVLAVARRSLAPDEAAADTDLSLVGLVALGDPPRPGAARALREAAALGLSVKILTGDAARTALALARRLGLAVGPAQVLTPADWGWGDPAAVERGIIFAEVTPADKYQIVRLLQAADHQVAVTGDGVNDAPALQAADVGIALYGGTDVAKMAADLVLLDDDLGVIVAAVREGRRLFRVLQHYLLYTLAGNLASVLVVAVASLLLDFLPLLPAQVLLLNLLTDLPMLALATDRVDPAEVTRPLRWHLRLVVEPGLALGLLNAVAALALLRLLRGAPPPVIQTAWFLFLGLTGLLLLLVVRSRAPLWRTPAPSGPLLGAMGLAVGVLVGVAAYPPLGRLFGLVPLAPAHLLMIGGLSLLFLLTAEGLKRAPWPPVGSSERPVGGP